MRFIFKKQFLTTIIIFSLFCSLYTIMSSFNSGNNGKVYVYAVFDKWCGYDSGCDQEAMLNGTVKITLIFEESKVHYYVKWTYFKWERFEYGVTDTPISLQPFNDTIELGDEWYWFEVPIYYSGLYYCPYHGIINIIFFNPMNISESVKNFAENYPRLSNVSVMMHEDYIEVMGYHISADFVITRVIIRVNYDGVPIMIISEGVRTITLQEGL